MKQDEHDAKLERITSMIMDRIETMQNQDIFDGRKQSRLHDYLLWALEECETNDGLQMEIKEEEKTEIVQQSKDDREHDAFSSGMQNIEEYAETTDMGDLDPDCAYSSSDAAFCTTHNQTH